jgi:hypothetical protein
MYTKGINSNASINRNFNQDEIIQGSCPVTRVSRRSRVEVSEEEYNELRKAIQSSLPHQCPFKVKLLKEILSEKIRD